MPYIRSKGGGTAPDVQDSILRFVHCRRTGVVDAFRGRFGPGPVLAPSGVEFLVEAPVAGDHRIEKDQPAGRLPQAETAPRPQLPGRRNPKGPPPQTV